VVIVAKRTVMRMLKRPHIVEVVKLDLNVSFQNHVKVVVTGSRVMYVHGVKLGCVLIVLTTGVEVAVAVFEEKKNKC
jgi:hypothetical protein